MQKILKWAATLAVAGMAGAVMVASAAYLYLAPLLPAAETYRDVQLETPLRIYTSDRRLIDEIGNRRDPVDYGDIPALLIDALIATEDLRFYSHPGVDLQSLVRGFYGIIRGVNLGGGSTITMQLTNNLSFDSDNVYLRKIKSIPFALQIERELTKEEVLTLYLNTAYFGAGADGIGAAAYVYYGKEVNELSLAEAAMMISLLPCPSACNPLSNPTRSIERRRIRLANMLRQGMINQPEFADADRSPITARRRNRDIEVSAPYVAEMVRQQLYGEHGEEAYSQGFEVVTTIDGDKQLVANRALVDGLETYYDIPHGYRGPTANYPQELYADRSGDARKAWVEELQQVSVFGNQQPAIVTSLDDLSFEAVLKSGETAKVEWDGMSWAYKFNSRNDAWPPPQIAADVVQTGDLIRLKNVEGEWQLGQVPDIQGALVSMSPSNGEIIALVGGYDFRRSQVNRVVTARPPGSNFKPFLYGTALEQGYSAATTINDAPITRGGYRPNNYENNFLGPITLRYALKESRNVPAVRLYDQVGDDKVLAFAAKFGFQTQNFPRNDLTVALGSQDVQPLEIVTAYSAIANGGYKVEPWFIKEISNLADGTVYEATPITVCESCQTTINDAAPGIIPAPRIIDPQVAFILNSMLRSVIEEGSGARVNREIGRSDLMGKTGTTNGPQELWFSGFNRDIATTVFIGFDQPEPLGEREQGATIAVPIWINFMKVALQGMPENTMKRPDGIEDRLINKTTGAPATPGEPDTIFEYFRTENAPTADGALLPSIDPAGEENEELSTETIF
ncbi:MAG: peptidase [SAR86 cluster bacterium]|uniref:Penicillin-binding protein 1A n=1 Tax=SAR86 cluster bacterium TaxID=2030880 RepID=A0A2A4XGM1_9GAMM|nr:MAG: peptidase [SAR86 cluster bacterium]